MRTATCYDIQILSPWGVPIGAYLLRRLDAVASDIGLDRPDALHAALLCWLEQEERKHRWPRPHTHDTCVDEDRRAHRVRTPTDICLRFGAFQELMVETPSTIFRPDNARFFCFMSVLYTVLPTFFRPYLAVFRGHQPEK